jgi:hypothetical protein
MLNLEEVQARPSEKRRSPSRRVSAAFDATPINTYRVLWAYASVVSLFFNVVKLLALARVQLGPMVKMCVAHRSRLRRPSPFLQVAPPPNRNMIGALVGN